jgi:electron transport complex protein RnfA
VGELFLILFSTCLVNNLVLDYLLGTDPIIAVSKNPAPALDMCLLMLIVMPLTGLFSYGLNFSILVPLGLEHLQLISVVLMVAAITLLTGFITGKYLPVLIPLVMVNCTVLGLALLITANRSGWSVSVFYGLGSAAGFSLVLMTLSAIRDKVSVSDVPLPFKGVAILMITLGLISMAFMGFNGVIT